MSAGIRDFTSYSRVHCTLRLSAVFIKHRPESATGELILAPSRLGPRALTPRRGRVVFSCESSSIGGTTLVHPAEFTRSPVHSGLFRATGVNFAIFTGETTTCHEVAERVIAAPGKIDASASRHDELSASFMETMTNSRVIFTCGNTALGGKVEQRWLYFARNVLNVHSSETNAFISAASRWPY